MNVRAAIASVPAPAAFAGSDWAEAAASAVSNAPYLARLIDRRPDLCEQPDANWAERTLAEALSSARAIAHDPPPIAEAMSALRRAKDGVHLAAAMADLARAWPLHRVTGALTDFADAALRAALSVAAVESARRGDIKLAPFDDPRGAAPGVALIAMGKMGAGELNYSSDIDFSVFFDAELLRAAEAREPRIAAVRLVAPIVRVLEEITEEGYVFRTDLRLRPDPGSTPVAVSMASAEHYYQTLGQNWERCAFIKARACAGDVECGRAFLASLEPFVWRKHLDFAAVEDVHSIKRQILSAHKSAELNDPVFDVKLGRGGIRDIELFAQTQQLILGGRSRKLRLPGTLAALDALAEAGAIAGGARDSLHHAYVFFREVEHRVQMLNDEQTHKVPADADLRGHVAALCGFASRADFDRELVERRKIVADIDHQLFGRGESLADPMGSLIFTGVEDHPETLKTIARLGYARPDIVSQTIRGWHHGRIRAMRSERARELLTRLTPRLLRSLANAGDPDQVFARFASFFAGLVAGVQVLSLFDAKTALLDLLARLFAMAPRLADDLAQRPALLDALIDRRFATPLSQDIPGARLIELQERIAGGGGFETALNVARRFQREEAFRIGAQILESEANVALAGEAYTDLAEACVVAMTDAAVEEVERLQGKQPGAFCVLALGKFGGRELSGASDLDIMVVYDGPATAPDFYTKAAQRLISALSAPTEEGFLYEIDTKLRPSGSKGPVAVRFSSFERYYAEEAWTWELLALTRLRAVAGDAALRARVEASVRNALCKPRDAVSVLKDAADMRGRMARERPPRGLLDFKLAPGGLVDIEFIAQVLQLIHAPVAPQVLSPNTAEALTRLGQAGLLVADTKDRLVAGLKLWSGLVQTLAVCWRGEANAEGLPAALQARLAAIGGCADFSCLEKRIRETQAMLRADFIRVIGPLGDGTAELARS